MEVKRYVTPDELSKLFPLKRSRIYYLIHTHGIPHIKRGRSVFFDLEEIQAWFEAGKVDEKDRRVPSQVQ